MRIIEIAALPNGAHRNQTGTFSSIPEGYAIIPETIEMPKFPFGEVTAEEVNGVMAVTIWVPGTIPEPEPEPEPELTQLDRIEAQTTYTAMMTDTLLEV